MIVMSPTGDDRPETADLEVMRVQNGSPVPSLALTDADFGGCGEPESGRSTLLRLAQLSVTYRQHIRCLVMFAAQCYASVDYVVMWCPSVHPSVTFVDSVCLLMVW